MHLIKDIREYLGLTQEELAGYLCLSIHTVQAIEQGLRQLSSTSQMAAATILKAIHDRRESGAVNDPVPAPDYQLRYVKRLLRRYRYRLDQVTHELESMQQVYAAACFNLGVYQLLAQTLPNGNGNEDNQIRWRWTALRAEETLQQIRENNETAQGILKAKIAGLKGTVLALEVSDTSQTSATPPAQT